MPLQQRQLAPNSIGPSPAVDDRQRDHLEDAVREALPNLARVELRARAGRAAGRFRDSGIVLDYAAVEGADEEEEISGVVGAVLDAAEAFEARQGPHVFQAQFFVHADGKVRKLPDAVAFTVSGDDLASQSHGVRDEAMALLSFQSKVIRESDSIIVRQHKAMESMAAAFSKFAEPAAAAEVHKIEAQTRLAERNLDLQELIERNEASLKKWELGMAPMVQIGAQLGTVLSKYMENLLHNFAPGQPGATTATLKDLWSRTKQEPVRKAMDDIDPELFALWEALVAAPDDGTIRNLAGEFRKRLMGAGRPIDPLVTAFQSGMSPQDFQGLAAFLKGAGVL